MAFRPLKLASPSGSNEALSTSLFKINDMLEELYQTADDLAVATVEGDLSGVSQHIVPGVADTYDLGSPSNRWRSLYVSDNTIHIGSSRLSVDFNGNLVINGNEVTKIVSYNDLLNKPLLSTVATSGSYDDLFDTPELATVATTGRFTDLINKPTTLAGYGITDEIGASVRIQNDAPTNPSLGDLWWEGDTGKLKIYDDSGETPVWIDTSSKGIETVDDDISINSTNGEIVVRSINDRVQIIAGETKHVNIFGSDIVGGDRHPGGNINVGQYFDLKFPPQITKSQSDWQQSVEANTNVGAGLHVSGDLIVGFGGRLCIREKILFQDGTLQDTAYQGRELQQHVITSGVFYKHVIAESASGIGWGGSDEFGHCVSIYGNHLVVGAPKYIADGDTHAIGRAHIYNLTTGSLITTLNTPIIFEDRIDANFGAACASNSYAHFIGMPGDDSGFANRAMGRVEFYSASSGNYLNFISPSEVPESGDMRFGASIAASENLLVIAAPDYPNPLGGTGRIYVYNSIGTILYGTVDNPYTGGTYGTSLSIHQDLGVGIDGYYNAEVIVVGSNIAVSKIYVNADALIKTPYSQHSYQNWLNPNTLDNNFGKFIGGSKNYIAITSYHASEGMKVYVWDDRGGVIGDWIPPGGGPGQIDQTKRLKWIFTPPSSDPTNDFGKGLQLLEGDILAVAHPAAANGAGTILFYDLNTGTILNEVTLDLPNNGAQLGKNSVLLTDSYLIANAPGKGNIYVYDYQKTLISSASTKDKVLAADGFGGFGLKDLNGNFTLDSSVIDTDDSSPITIVPPVITNSNLTVGNDLTVQGFITAASIDTHALTQVSASDGEALVWSNANQRWQPATIASGGSAPSTARQTSSATTSLLNDDASENVTISSVAKTYALLTISTSAAAWVTLYSDTTSRTNDAGRNEFTDPTPGSGVIAEVITSGVATQLITPGTFGWNNDGTPSDNVYAKVVNKSGSAAEITVTLKFVPLEF